MYWMDVNYEIHSRDAVIVPAALSLKFQQGRQDEVVPRVHFQSIQGVWYSNTADWTAYQLRSCDGGAFRNVSPFICFHEEILAVPAHTTLARKWSLAVNKDGKESPSFNTFIRD